jgi:antitoxin MazE
MHEKKEVGMTRRIFRAGNSLVVSLPREAIEALGGAEGTEISLDIDREGRRVVLLRAEEGLADVDEAFARQVAEFIEVYRPALEALSRME